MCVYIIMPPSHTFVHTNEDMTRLIYMRVWRIQGEARGLPSLLVHICDMTRSCVGHYTFICVTWLIHTCDMTRLHVWKGEARSLSSLLVHMRGPSLWYGRHETCTCVTWHSYTRDMTRGHVRHDSFVCVRKRGKWCTFNPGSSPAMWSSVLQCVAVCCSVLQCVAVCCSVLQCFAVCCIRTWIRGPFSRL